MKRFINSTTFRVLTSLALLVTFTLASTTFRINKSQVSASQGAGASCRRALKAVLYPFIPEKGQFFEQVEHAFELKYPEIDLQIIDLSDNYYNTKKPNNIIDAKADVYEIDSVFLSDFVTSKHIQELPSAITPAVGQVLENAKRGSQINSKWYGSPHWVCGNFLFYVAGDTTLQSVKTLSDLEKAVGKSPSAGHGLLIDLKGKSTLGELYLDTAFDRYVEISQVAPHLDVFDADIEKDLGRANLLCSTGFCRSDRYHETTGFYARQFTRRRARAMVGYSEMLHFALLEAQDSCGDDEQCLTQAMIDVTGLPLDDGGSHPISWVDSLAIDTKCTGQCQKDAISLIEFLTSDETFLKALMPDYMQPARYLLPARASVYNNADLIKAAPLYPKLRAIIEKAVTPTGPQLNDKLRAFGEKLDAELK